MFYQSCYVENDYLRVQHYINLTFKKSYAQDTPHDLATLDAGRCWIVCICAHKSNAAGAHFRLVNCIIDFENKGKRIRNVWIHI